MVKNVHLISRQQARALGIKRFFTGLPCKNGHISERVVSSTCCLSCDAEKSSKYRSKNPDKARASVRDAARKNADKRSESNKIWRSRNRDKIISDRVSYRENNREKVSESKKRYYLENKSYVDDKKREWALKNKKRLFVAQRAWRKENRERIRTSNRNRRAMLREAEGHHDANDIENLLMLQGHKCAHCSKSVKKKYHVDHVVAIVNGGSNWPTNLQILCPGCNMSKGAKDAIEWAQSRGKLL